MEDTTTDTAAFPDAIQDSTIGAPPDSATPDRDDTYTELLECELTEEDRDEKRKELESTDREIIRLEEEKKAEAKIKNNLINPLKAKREAILQALDSGTEKRHVEVYERIDERLGKVEVRRVDSDELVKERAMTSQERDEVAEERQGDLFASGGSEPPADLVDPADNTLDDPKDLEPTPEALAQAATDENRVVRISAKEARAKKKQREAAAAEAGGGDAAE